MNFNWIQTILNRHKHGAAATKIKYQTDQSHPMWKTMWYLLILVGMIMVKITFAFKSNGHDQYMQWFKVDKYVETHKYRNWLYMAVREREREYNGQNSDRPFNGMKPHQLNG